MELRDILVHVDHTNGSDSRLDVALELARTHGAHLRALYVDPGPLVAVLVDAPPSAELLAELDRTRTEQRAEAQRRFEARTRDAGVNCELHVEEGDPARHVTLYARYADLVVIGQPEDEAADGAVLPEGVVVECARPVLIVPYIGPRDTVGRRVLVAWNDSRESARALNDALPLLGAAAEVRVLAVNPPPEAGRDLPYDCAEVCTHLARHGVPAEAQHAVAPNLGVGDALLSRASDFGADLIVMGAYGHSRFREFLLGGASRHLLRHMTVPVLMSH